MKRVRAAHYSRRLPTSADRVWENVRDWEHLPWLHHTSFASIELLEEGEWGWKARMGLQPGSEEIVVELQIDASAPRYVARTVEGSLRGAEVWTEVRRRSDLETEVDVEFWVPDGAPAAVEEIGRGYLALYRRLWDEDEAMMMRRDAELAELGSSPPTQRRERSGLDTALLCLGLLDDVRRRLPLLVGWEGRRFRILEVEGELLVHATRCPHWLGPLESAEVRDGCVVCPWHGYRFDLRSGRSSDGRGLRLDRAPDLVVDAEASVWLRARG